MKLHSSACRSLALTTLLAAPAVAQLQYEVTDLGTLGGAESVAFGLNDLGQVVGWSHIPDCTTSTGLPCRRGYFWSDGVMIDLGLLLGDEDSFARAINNAGLIVGTSESGVQFGSGTFHGVTWNGGPGALALPDLGQGQSFAHDVNEAGVVAGHTQDPSVNRDRAVTWTNGVVTNHGGSESHSYNRGQGLSDAGQLAGFGWNLFQPNDALSFDGAKWGTIGGLDGPFQNAEAQDVNDLGQVVGYSAFNSGAWRAAIWDTNTGKVKDAGTVAGFDTAELFDINNQGVAVGNSYPGDLSAPSRGVLWNGTELLDLNDLLVPGTNMHVLEGREINELGEIAGTALTPAGFRAVLLKPIAPPSPWTDLGHGLASPSNTPELDGVGTLVGGTTTTIEIRGALAGGSALMVAGFQQIDLDLGFGVLVPSLDLIVEGLTLDGAGATDLTVTWPTGLPSGSDLYLQAWIPDAQGPSGLTATNGLRATAP